eukprot:CAMPEP_0206372220 /NCGR_PEP_ID=MMETSP0294-20121207/6980_1 /ASSEMBLY_ACC=CAM_ASM_000327 /TAXON_ID=39354 /ORGANISM="Heterosigma akashiwo, Strain CCMP2393" /LENGTH=73 /DNA_ID=CAMNT_0053819559 /DNA_START=83 /DNA_END=307 /DNA_ORIENTATION=+
MSSLASAVIGSSQVVREVGWASATTTRIGGSRGGRMAGRTACATSSIDRLPSALVLTTRGYRPAYIAGPAADS